MTYQGWRKFLVLATALIAAAAVMLFTYSAGRGQCPKCGYLHDLHACKNCGWTACLDCWQKYGKYSCPKCGSGNP
jgi:hypothetical protein